MYIIRQKPGSFSTKINNFFNKKMVEFKGRGKADK